MCEFGVDCWCVHHASLAWPLADLRLPAPLSPPRRYKGPKPVGKGIQNMVRDKFKKQLREVRLVEA